MRNRVALILPSLLIVSACRYGRQDAAETSGAGATTYATGALISRAETTHVTGNTTQASAGDVSVTLDKAAYTAGATVAMTVKSQSRDTLGYNQCSSRVVERQEASSWVQVPEPDRMCTMELRLLNPNETQTAKTDLPATLVSGNYRLVLTLGKQSPAGGSVRAVSPTFRVS